MVSLIFIHTYTDIWLLKTTQIPIVFQDYETVGSVVANYKLILDLDECRSA